jgi:hypothetical protein
VIHDFVLQNDLLEDYYFHYWIFGGVVCGYGDRTERTLRLESLKLMGGFQQIAGDTGGHGIRLGTGPYAK